MATYTPNLNLEKPDSSDAFGDFRASYNDNMDKIDAGIGSGGGHIIIDPNGTQMAQESGLQFTGGVTVTDDNVNGVTVVDITGGGSNVYGAFIDTNRIIASGTITQGGERTYLATEDVALDFLLYASGGSNAYLTIDGKNIFSSSSGVNRDFVFLKKGQTVAFRSYGTDGNYTAYGLKQGTNGIFAPVIYSDTERVIGVWRDNKPLYQKTINFGALPNADQKAVNHNIADLDNIVSVSAVASGATNNFSLSYIDTNSLANGIGIYVSNTAVTIRCGSNRSSYNAYVTLQYTKTTDTAGSGNWNTDGTPLHHYSTNEQVIGTWIDGKPLYERTVDGLSITPSTSWSGAFATSLGIKVPVNVTFYNALSGGNPITVFVNEVQQYNGGIRIKVNSSFNPSRTIHTMVIQYTKQADYT